MERIQQALERARRARTLALQRRHEGGGAPVASGELQIEYQQTSVLETTPEILRRNRIIAAAHDEPAFEAFRILRTQVLGRLEARGGRTVAICGASQGEGKTLVAVNLALSIAQQLNRTALLVDLDLRNPSIHRCFGLETAYGLSDYLEDGVPLESCLVNPGIKRLVLLPQVRHIPHSSELLATARMASLAQELRNRYRDRVVIFDCPPLLMTNDSLIVMDYADGCLLVIQEGRARRNQVERAVELLGEDRLLGTVLNNARAGVSGYYDYGYGYGYGYGPRRRGNWLRRRGLLPWHRSAGA